MNGELRAGLIEAAARAAYAYDFDGLVEWQKDNYRREAAVAVDAVLLGLRDHITELRAAEAREPLAVQMSRPGFVIDRLLSDLEGNETNG